MNKNNPKKECSKNERLRCLLKGTRDNLIKQGHFSKEISDTIKAYSFPCCPDQLVASLEIDYSGKIQWVGQRSLKTKVSASLKDETKLFERININKKFSPEHDILLLIIESPHKHEFNGEKANGPAFGAAGTRINNYLAKILEKEGGIELDNSTYDLLLINIIQYACSLEQNLKLIKNKMLKDSWNSSKKEFKKDFKNRLAKILQAAEANHKNVLIINCCTSTIAGIKSSVTEIIKEIIKETLKETNSVSIYSCHHPSTWNKNTHIKKIS